MIRTSCSQEPKGRRHSSVWHPNRSSLRPRTALKKFTYLRGLLVWSAAAGFGKRQILTNRLPFIASAEIARLGRFNKGCSGPNSSQSTMEGCLDFKGLFPHGPRHHGMSCHKPFQASPVPHLRRLPFSYIFITGGRLQKSYWNLGQALVSWLIS